jgi:Tfp pilus assembly protein PilE
LPEIDIVLQILEHAEGILTSALSDGDRSGLRRATGGSERCLHHIDDSRCALLNSQPRADPLTSCGSANRKPQPLSRIEPAILATDPSVFSTDANGVAMKKFLGALFVVLTVVVSLSVLAVGQSPTPSNSDAVAAITQMEHDAVKADLAQDASFYERYLADSWTGGTSRGTWDTKESLLANMKDTKNNKTNSESISDVKVRVQGDLAVATYKSTYDAMIQGKHYARTIISTDTFLRQNGEWKQVAGHSSQAVR